jgi:hypothetical protein
MVTAGISKKQARITILVVLAIGILQYVTTFFEIVSSSFSLQQIRPSSSSSSLTAGNNPIERSVKSALNDFVVDHPYKKSNSQKNERPLNPIFYNVYIPPEPEKQPNAFRIIEEQMIQRNISQDPEGYIYFVHIGGYISKLTDDFCRPHCSKIIYKELGNEVDTLQALWEYCQNNPQDIVTYIHNKGSFHNNAFNDRIRQMATKAALDCRIELAKTIPAHRSHYNTCAARLTILPQYLSSGNMWSARCGYVRGLLPPRNYEGAMQKMYDETLFRPDYDEQHNSCLKPIRSRENHLGTGRFAYERWIWSHPHVVPADIAPSDKVMHKSLKTIRGYNVTLPTWKPHFRRSFGGNPKNFALDQGFGVSSFARLEGRLHEWKHLYGLEPKNTSWIWSFYKGYETGTPAFKIRYCGKP